MNDVIEFKIDNVEIKLPRKHAWRAWELLKKTVDEYVKYLEDIEMETTTT